MTGTNSKQFGKYHLIAHLATGGMAKIYLASQKSIGGFEKILVIKSILPHLSRDKKFIEMFLDEARIAAQLNHPNVVQIFDLGRVDGMFFIAMEYLSGESLSMVIKTCTKMKRAIPANLAAGILMQAAEGLHHAHTMKSSDGTSLGIVHRDISPQNIFVQYDGGVKIVDFGIAKAASRSSHTKTGTLKGKYSYMSPEQVSGKELDARSDIFALGIVLWECLVGRKLFNQANDLELLKAVVATDIPSPQEVNPNVPAELASIAMKALEKNREDRFQSAAEFRSALSGYIKTINEDYDTVAIGRFMHKIFRKRIEKKHTLIESARTVDQELGDTLFDGMNNYLSDTEISVPNSASGLQAQVPAQRNSLSVPRLAILFILLTIVVVSLILLLSPSETTSQAKDFGASMASAKDVDAGSTTSQAIAGKNDQEAKDGAGNNSIDGGSITTNNHADHDMLSARNAKADSKTEHNPKKELASSRKKRKKKKRNISRRKNTKLVAVAQENSQKSELPPGKLRLVTIPWSNVYFKGKNLGQTPLIDTELPAGPVELRVVNKDAGIDKVIVVKIRSGKKNVFRKNLY